MPTRPPMFRPPGWKPAPAKRPEAQEPFYGSAAWRVLRAACLKRDRYQCVAVNCATPNRGQGQRLVADHIVERRKGGADTLSNLRTYCPDCHNRRHGNRGRG